MCTISVAAAVCRNKMRKGIINVSIITGLSSTRQEFTHSCTVDVDYKYMMTYPNVVLKEMRRIRKHYPNAIFTMR